MADSLHSKIYKRGKSYFQNLTFGLSIAFRIYFSTFLILLTTSTAFVFLRFFQEKESVITSDILNLRISSLQAAQRIKESVVSYDNVIFRYVATKSDSELVHAESLRQDALREVEQLNLLSNNKVISSRLVKLRTRLNQYFQEANKLVQYARSNNLPPSAGLFEAASWARSQGTAREEMSVLTTEGSVRLEKVFALCDELLTYNNAQLAAARTEIDTLHRQSQRFIRGVFYVSFAVVLLISMTLAITLIGPLRILMGGVKQLESGKFDIELPVTTPTEIGKLTHAFNRMAKTINVQSERLIKESITDNLTGVYNQRYFSRRLVEEMDRCRRTGEPLSVMMIDVDYFKKYNDSYGHEMGNVILRRIAGAIKENLRNIDLLFRYGGDEFAVVLPNVTAADARKTAERMVEMIRQTKYPGSETANGPKVTLSIGGASFPEGTLAMEDLVAKADEALYSVKSRGRDGFEWHELKLPAV